MHKEKFIDIESDIAIIGAGIAGLMIAKHLGDAGYKVTVFEKEKNLAGGQTTKNEGWLHAGTYHSVAIENDQDAKAVVERTRYGHEYILGYAPEIVEYPSHASYVVFDNMDMVHKTVARWNEHNISAQPISLHNLFRIAPQLDHQHLIASFEVEDKSINSRELCRKLKDDVLAAGNDIVSQVTFIPEDDEHAIIYFQGDSEPFRVRAQLFVVAAGSGIKNFFEQLTGNFFPMRFWKSHLIVVPKLAEYNAFYVDPGKAGAMQHGQWSIVGINKDGIPTPDYPGLEPHPNKGEQINSAAKELFPDHSVLNDLYRLVACVKPDLYFDISHSLNLNVTVGEPVTNYIYALPGKMTESPYLAKKIVELAQIRETIKSMPDRGIIFDRNHTIAPRPLDTYQTEQE